MEEAYDGIPAKISLRLVSRSQEVAMTSEQDFTGEERRISYQVLRKGVPVRASGGEEIGTVEHVLEVPELDVFDGIVLTTADGLRFADADQVADITDRYVVLNLPAEETERLGRPEAPAVYHADPSEHAGGSLHDWFGRMFGRAHWKRDR
jgi:hypothetical protein